jgi:hypothetical protein
MEQLRQFDQFFGARKSLFPEDPTVAEKIIEGLITTQPFFIAADTMHWPSTRTIPSCSS